jgi:outer membrane receptor protein involved in Fe transport
MSIYFRAILPILILGVLLSLPIRSIAQVKTVFAGTVVTPQFQLVPGATVEVRTSAATLTTTTDAEGRFSIEVPSGDFTATFSGKNLEPVTRTFKVGEKLADVQIRITYVVPPLTETVTIQADSLTPQIEFRNDSVYKNTLFGRDDQLVQTLNAGINAGQHEGGGKSLEIRRYGFNLDHGGVNGGLKIVVDNVQQNQGTQGHGQGYLGNLKSLSPELVEDVSIINGPFSAAYGDFSGLGVVQIRQKESLSHQFTARVQGGSFNTVRGFFAYSPKWKNIDAFISYEPSYTDGPFINPLKYRRDNVSGNFTYRFDDDQALGVKFNFGRNDFFSSGQIPLDLVENGDLDRFEAIDPENGGKVGLGNIATYYRKQFSSGATLKADAFVGRSLFDLFSNFTFFTADPVYGDEIQQHDSRLQQGGTVQFLQPYKFFGSAAVVTVGGNVHANQINVGLYPSVGRAPNRKFLQGNIANPNVLLTSARADVNNYAGYVQNEIAFFDGHLRLDTGLRYDRFTFDVDGFELGEDRVDLVGKESSGQFQPKLSLAWSPFDTLPITFYGNYGRGISSQDARGVVREPSSPKISTTDFYQAGGTYNGGRVSFVLSSFLIDRSNEQVYIPDDGSVEFAGASRSYGIETRTSIKLTRNLSFNGGLTKVIKAFYPGEFGANGKRIVVDSSPHLTANGSFVLSELHGFNSSLSWRHISNYRLDGEDPSIRAAGHDVVDLAISKRLTNWVDLNFSIDNILNKKYYETQNFFESRACPTCDLTSRIHATPGYPFAVNVGVTFRIGSKK